MHHRLHADVSSLPYYVQNHASRADSCDFQGLCDSKGLNMHEKPQDGARGRTRRSYASFSECLKTDTRKGLVSVGDSMKASVTALDQPYSVLLE